MTNGYLSYLSISSWVSRTGTTHEWEFQLWTNFSYTLLLLLLRTYLYIIYESRHHEILVPYADLTKFLAAATHKEAPKKAMTTMT